VIDSGSSDGSVEFVESLPVTLIGIENSEFGHGRTRNLGARLSNSEFVSFLSQDAIPVLDDWLDSILKPFEDPEVVGVYGRQKPHNTHVCESFFLERTYSLQAARRASPQASPTLKDIFFSNVNSVIRRSVWEEFPFDENIPMSEDQLWAKTVLLAGHTIVYAPDAAVYHSHRYSCADVFRRYYESGVSLQDVVGGRVGGSWQDSLRYLMEEFRAAGELGPRCLLFAMWYEICRVGGFCIGNHEKRLPAILRKFVDDRIRATAEKHIP
jgi:rhamnosyltransferase